MFSHYATRKISPIFKISTFSEDLSFLNPRSHLKKILMNQLRNCIGLFFTEKLVIFRKLENSVTTSSIRPHWSRLSHVCVMVSPVNIEVLCSNIKYIIAYPKCHSNLYPIKMVAGRVLWAHAYSCFYLCSFATFKKKGCLYKEWSLKFCLKRYRSVSLEPNLFGW